MLLVPPSNFRQTTLLSPNTCTWFSFLFYPMASQKPVLSSMNIKDLEFVFFSLILKPILTVLWSPAMECSHWSSYQFWALKSYSVFSFLSLTSRQLRPTKYCLTLPAGVSICFQTSNAHLVPRHCLSDQLAPAGTLNLYRIPGSDPLDSGALETALIQTTYVPLPALPPHALQSLSWRPHSYWSPPSLVSKVHHLHPQLQ